MNQNLPEQQNAPVDTAPSQPIAITRQTYRGERWLSALSIGIVAIYVLLFLTSLPLSGPKDHDQFLVFHELQYWNSQLFGLAKQWTPLMCSGLSLAGEPQVPFMSMSMMLSYLLGPLWGLKLATLLYFIVGWAGAYLYAGLWLKTFTQRSLAAALFIGNGFFFCRLAYGHIDFIPFLSLPLMLWTLHHSVLMASNIAWRGALKLLIVTLLLAAGIAVVVDGSPVAIIHLMFWIGLYAVVLSCTLRSWTPVVMLSSAAMIALLLDAGYMWPMLEAQSMFPRHRPDSFTSFLSLIWFALLPARGKLLPANGNGHELSVFIGPVLAYALWRYRHWLQANVPSAIKQPLLTVSIVSIVLGMGSLKPLHIPTWLSPFDLLHPLPGFRSLNVTGRYWGFLSLPLSLFAAAVLPRLVDETRGDKRWRFWIGFAVVLQLGFQSQTLFSKWWGSAPYKTEAFAQTFKQPETIDYVIADPDRQGQFIAPTRGVIDCYNEDDFIRAEMNTGTQLVREQLNDGAAIAVQPSTHAAFVTWSHIRLWLDSDSPVLTSTDENTRLQLVLNQAFHPLWQVDQCSTTRSATNNLVVDCPLSRWRSGAVDLHFNDVLSTQAAMVSVIAWRWWLCGIAALILLSYAARERSAA